MGPVTTGVLICLKPNEMKQYKVVNTTDGQFAICDLTELGNGWRIWSPVSTKRYKTELSAKIALANLIGYGVEPEPKQEKKPDPVPIHKGVSYQRDDFRIVKLAKGVFAVEMKRFGKWEQVAQKKTYAKAEKFIISKVYGTD